VIPATLGNVDRVVTDSQDACADLARFLGLPAEKLRVVPLGVSEAFRPIGPEQAAAVAARFGLNGPYVLAVGTRQARKNQAGLVAAFCALRDELPEHCLAIAGPTIWREDRLREQVAALGMESRVRLLGYVPDEALPALYSAASLFVFPSLYEGFGLPVLEAMACGTPVVCSNRSSLPEVAGEAALLVDPTSRDELAGAIRRALLDVDLRDGLRERGLARAREYTWQRTASRMVDVYNELLDS
jgi:glycosyltransferase involved in cell wall biosynthesis